MARKTKKKTVKVKKTGFWAKVKAEFTTTAIVLIPIAIGINQVGRLISTALGLPIFLDTIGTVFMAMLAGPWVASVGGFLTNVVTAIAYGRATSVFFGVSTIRRWSQLLVCLSTKAGLRNYGPCSQQVL
jgi:energy-coupling factor transport system substrate-specific component